MLTTSDGFQLERIVGLEPDLIIGTNAGIDDAFETDGGQAHIPLERLSVLDTADVLLWATEAPEDRVALEAGRCT